MSRTPHSRTATRRSVGHLSAVPNGDMPAESTEVVTGTLTPDQLDPDDFEAYPLEVLPPHRGEIPADFKPQWDAPYGPAYRNRWVVCGAFEDDNGDPVPRITIRVQAVGHGDRILDGYVSWLIAHLLNNRTEQDDRVTYEAWMEASRVAADLEAARESATESQEKP